MFKTSACSKSELGVLVLFPAVLGGTRELEGDHVDVAATLDRVTPAWNQAAVCCGFCNLDTVPLEILDNAVEYLGFRSIYTSGITENLTDNKH